MPRRGALIVAAAAGCGSCLLLFVALSSSLLPPTTPTSDSGRGGGRSSLLSPPGGAAEVVYAPGDAAHDAAMLQAHYEGRSIEYVPAKELRKEGFTNIPPASGGFEYVPATELRREGFTNIPPASGGTLHAHMLAANASNATGGDVVSEDTSIYYTADASCAITNLVSRAEQIIPYFELCGYMTESEFEHEMEDEEGVKPGALPSCYGIKRTPCKALLHCAYDSNCGCHPASCNCGSCAVR